MIYLPKLYSQKASGWAKIFLGNSKSSFADYGCLATDQTMIARYYGYSVNPKEYNAKMKELGGFDGDGNYRWGSFPKLFSKIKENYKRTNYKLTDNDIDTIKDSIDKKFPVMLWIDYNPRTVKNDMHWVIVVDYDNTDENNFTIVDPIDGQMRSLKDYLGWFIPSARRSIEAFVTYSGNVKNVKSENSDVCSNCSKLVSLNKKYLKKINEARDVLNN